MFSSNNLFLENLLTWQAIREKLIPWIYGEVVIVFAKRLLDDVILANSSANVALCFRQHLFRRDLLTWYLFSRKIYSAKSYCRGILFQEKINLRTLAEVASTLARNLFRGDQLTWHLLSRKICLMMSSHESLELTSPSRRAWSFTSSSRSARFSRNYIFLAFFFFTS